MPVTTEILKVKALELARHQSLSRSTFETSRNWITKFLKRKGFSLRRQTGICQKLPEASFQWFVILVRQKRGYQWGQIGNADQTPMYFDVPANTTVEVKGAKQVCVLSSGHEKTRVMAIVRCTADGHKLPQIWTLSRRCFRKTRHFLETSMSEPTRTGGWTPIWSSIG